MKKIVVELQPDSVGGVNNQAWSAWEGGTIRLIQFYQRGDELPIPLDSKITVTIEETDGGT